MTLSVMREFFFWNMVLNMGLLIFSFIMILSVKKLAYKIHGRMFGLKDEQLDAIWYSIFGAYKICIFMFNVVPYVALRIMESGS